jgi:hypothetical protein
MPTRYLRLVVDGQDNFCHSDFLQSLDLDGRNSVQHLVETVTYQCNNRKPESDLG